MNKQNGNGAPPSIENGAQSKSEEPPKDKEVLQIIEKALPDAE